MAFARDAVPLLQQKSEVPLQRLNPAPIVADLNRGS
jgi:hypothetical protein